MIELNNAKKYTFLLAALLGALVFISIFGQMKIHIEGLQLHVAFQAYDKGFTEVQVPPLGTVRARTHYTPIMITLRLENIDLQLIQRLLSGKAERNDIIRQSKDVLQKTLILFILKLLALAPLAEPAAYSSPGIIELNIISPVRWVAPYWWERWLPEPTIHITLIHSATPSIQVYSALRPGW